MLKITGYGDRLYCRPGQSIEFKVNCELATYHTDIVRIICGDTNPDGPGVKEVVIETPVNGDYPGRPQTIAAGSYVEVPNAPALESFSMQAYLWPTTPTKGVQGVVTRWSESGGFALMVDADGGIALKLVDGEKISVISSGRPMQPRRWYRVGASLDAVTRTVEVYQVPLVPVPGIDDAASATAPWTGGTGRWTSDVRRVSRPVTGFQRQAR